MTFFVFCYINSSMATLNIKEVSNRPDKPQSAATFIKKILQEEDFGGDF